MSGPNPTAERRSYMLRERSPRLCILSGADVAHLRAQHRDHVNLRHTGQRGQFHVTPTGHVGTIVCPASRLIIRPKIRLGNLFHLLDPTAPIACTEDHAESVPGTETFNFLAARLAHLLAERLGLGLQRGYRERREAGPTLRGRLDVNVQMAAPRKDRLHCTFEEFTTDIHCNRVARSTVELLLQSPLLHHRVRAELERQIHELEAVQSCILNSDAFGCARPEAYEPLFGLARLLFDGLSAGPRSGVHRHPAFLLDMDSVFEHYASAGIRAAFARDGRYAVTMQPLHTISAETPGHPELKLRPDMLVSQGGQPVVVIDVKWKREVLEPGDVYQVLGYATALDSRRAALVYPGPRSRMWSYALASNISLDVYVLRVAGGRAECERSLASLGRQLKKRARRAGQR